MASALPAFGGDVLVAHARWALERAHQRASGLTDAALRVRGMTGAKTRHFYNNLCSLRGARYLEVGTWFGSSLVSALCANPALLSAVVVDDWSEFGGTRAEFDANVTDVLGGAPPSLTVVDGDCWRCLSPAPPPCLRPASVDIYVYDGPHAEEDHTRAITHFWPCLAERAIVVVDDWNWAHVRRGTLLGLAAVEAHVLFATSVTHAMQDGHTPAPTSHTDWWNGVGVFVVQKGGAS